MWNDIVIGSTKIAIVDILFPSFSSLTTTSLLIMTTWAASSGHDPGSEILPNIFDHYAQVKPDAIYAEYPVNPMTYEEGYRPITYKALANAINGVAGWLTKTLGPGTGETLAYLGPNDLRYPALVLGAVKAGYCVGWSFT